jgi:hypothetical protein
LIEEAEFSAPSLLKTLDIVSTFAHGCQSNENWHALSRGPFGDELINVAWSLYDARSLPREAWIRNTVAILLGHQWNINDIQQDIFKNTVRESLSSIGEDQKARVAALLCGLIWIYDEAASVHLVEFILLLGKNLPLKSKSAEEMTVWAIGLISNREGGRTDSTHTLDRQTLDKLVQVWRKNYPLVADDVLNFSIAQNIVFDRGDWRPDIGESQANIIESKFENPIAYSGSFDSRMLIEAELLLYYHSGREPTEGMIRWIREESSNRNIGRDLRPLISHIRAAGYELPQENAMADISRAPRSGRKARSHPRIVSLE